ncbi:MAG: hypothetical protein KDJ15_05370 [Alphaproteobacteria bacterium]|nr:hypothetical protein [Alphaproteobacteria bacterium]
MEQFFSLLYPLVAIISIVAYIPQIKTLLFATRSPQNISLSSWMMWVASSFLAFGYVATHVHDSMLCLTTGVNLGMVALTAGLVAYNRYIRFSDKTTNIRFLKAVPVRNEDF